MKHCVSEPQSDLTFFWRTLSLVVNFCLCQAEAGLQIQDLRSKKQSARCGPACEGCEGEAGDGIKGKGEDSEVNDPSGEAGQRQGGEEGE